VEPEIGLARGFNVGNHKGSLCNTFFPQGANDSEFKRIPSLNQQMIRFNFGHDRDSGFK
jgi:hypothetical protein